MRECGCVHVKTMAEAERIVAENQANDRNTSYYDYEHKAREYHVYWFANVKTKEKTERGINVTK